MSKSNNHQAQKNSRTCHTVNDVDWPGLRAAAVAIGIRPAARQAARDLPPDERERFVQRAMKRCSREEWLAKAEQDKADAVATSPTALSANVRTSAEALADTLNERKDKSALHLSKYIVDASERLEKTRGLLKYTRAGKDVVAMRSGIWPEDQPGTQVTVSVLGFAAVRVQEPQEQREND